MNISTACPILRIALAFAIIGAMRLQLYAQPATGTLEGRVFNAAAGTFLERARIAVSGTSLETFSDADGFYRLAGVPAGTVQVSVFYTGFPAQNRQVTVTAGQIVVHDIELSGAPATPWSRWTSSRSVPPAR